jgi:hypothetical protein
MTEPTVRADFPDEIPFVVDEISSPENPYCDQLVDGRECVGVAGHEDYAHCVPRPFSRDEKIDYLFDQAKSLESLIEQAGPLLEQAGPMLESLAPLLGSLGGGSAPSSPMSRIAMSLLR